MDLRVNAASLSTAAGDLRSGATGIQTALDNMDSELSQLQSNCLMLMPYSQKQCKI